MGFKQTVLELMSPSSEIVSPEADLTRLLQSPDLHPDDTKSMASRMAILKLNQLDPESCTFDEELKKLWDSVNKLEKQLPEVNALVIGLKAVLKKYANYANVQLRDENSVFNVADIDTAVESFNQMDAVQNSQLLTGLRVSGLLTESELNQCLFYQKTSAMKAGCDLMEALGKEPPILTLNGADVVLNPDDLGVDLDNLREFNDWLQDDSGSHLQDISQVHYFQIVEWLNTDIRMVTDQFGEGIYTENVFNAIFGKVFYLLIDSILSAKTTSIEKLPYLKFLYREVSRVTIDQPSYSMGLVVRSGLISIIGKIELEVFGSLNYSTKREISYYHRMIRTGMTNYPDMAVIQAFRSWIIKHGSIGDKSIDQMNYVFAASAWKKIQELGNVFPGMTSCMQLPDSKTVGSADAATGSASLADEIRKLQVDTDSVDNKGNASVHESVVERVKENHKFLLECRAKSQNDDNVRHIVREQRAFAAFLAREDDLATNPGYKISSVDASMGSTMLENIQDRTPVITESFILGWSK